MRRQSTFLLVGLLFAATFCIIRFHAHVDEARPPAAGSESPLRFAESAEKNSGRSPSSTVDETVAPRSPGHSHQAISAHAVIASRWADDTRPEQAAFRDWVGRYLDTTEPELREAMQAEGLRLASERRVALTRLIRTDPQAALASAVPVAVRTALPDAVVALLETRVAGRGELALNAVTPAPGGSRPDETSYRSALIGDVEYRAYVYGRRETGATVQNAAINGIAVDRLLAVSDSPLRLLEPGERPAAAAPAVSVCAACAAAVSAPSPGGLLYESAGEFGAAASYAHLLADAAALVASERSFVEADNRPGTNTVVGRPAKTWTHGTKKVLIIRVDFSDLAGAPQTESGEVSEDAAVEVFTAEGGVGDFFLASSFGKTSLTIRGPTDGDSPDVTEVFRLPRTALDYAITGDNAALHSHARAAASLAGYDLSAYDRVGVVFSSLSTLADGDGKKSKITYGGLATVIGPNFWVNGVYTFRVVAHEIGHTYGLRHANLWKVPDANPVSDAGQSLEYGDPFDLMGGGEDFTAAEDFGPWNKSILQWIPDTAVTVASGAGGTYRIHRIDAAGADLSLPRALKVVRDPARDYWIGLRRATDNPSLDGGAYVVWGYNVNRPGDLLDLATPGSDPADAGLPLGETFSDASAAISLKPVGQGGSGADEWIEVQVAIGRRVQWAAADVLASEQGGFATLTLRRTGDPGGTLSVAYQTENGSALAGIDYSASSGTVTWGNGDTVDKTVTIALVPDGEPETAQNFRVRLGSVVGGVIVGPAAITVNIAEPGVQDDTFRADFINSTVNRVLPLPDGSVIAGGSFVQLQDSAGTVLNGIGRIARFTATGAIDVEFAAGPGADDQVRALALQADGRILVGGDFTTFGGVTAGRIARLFPDGSVDPSFKPGAGANDDVHDILVQPDGRILVAGAFTSFGSGSTPRKGLVRLNPDGSIDASLANPGFSATTLRSLALQPDGKLLVAGGLSYSGQPGVGFKSGVARLNPDGSRDATFDVGYGAHTATGTTTSNNTLTSVFRVIVQNDGRVVVAGAFTGFGGKPRANVARLSSTGALDNTFVPAPSIASGALVVTGLQEVPGGRLLIGGNFSHVASIPCPNVAILDAAGNPDAAFASGGGYPSTVIDIALLPDGKALLSGYPKQIDESTVIRPMARSIPGLAGAPGVIEFSSDSYVGREGGFVTLAVNRRDGKFGPATVAYAAARGHSADTATAGADYTLAAGTLAWADGDDSERVITIPLVNDTVADDGETFTVRLGEPVLGGVSLGARRESVVTIEAFDARAQTIDFPPPGDILDTASLDLRATASSGLPVVFEVVGGLATLSGTTLTPSGAGIVTVKATQPGNANFDPAPPAERTFTVRTAGTVTLGNLTQTYAAVPRPITYVTSPAGAAISVTYAGSTTPPKDAGAYPVVATIVDPLVTGSGTGTMVITKAPLTIRPENQRRLVGTGNKPFVLNYAGFLGGDTSVGLDKAPTVKSTATKGSKPGDYPITANGGSDNNYALGFVPGILRVIGFGGTYETLLVSETDASLLGKLDLVVSATGPGFTGTLNLAGEGAALSVRGTITLAASVPVEEPAIALGETIPAAHGYQIKIARLAADEVRADLYRGGILLARGAGPRIFVPAAKTSVTWAGAYTAWLSDLTSETADDPRPVPVGVGHSVFTVPASGAFKFAASLPDGSKFSAALRPDSGAVYRVFGRPYGKRLYSYVAGELGLVAGNTRAFTWRKAIATGTTVDATFRSGFAVQGLAQKARWTPPKAATATAGALTWADILGLDPASGVFSFEASGVDFADLIDGLPVALAVSSAGKVTLYPPVAANPRKFTQTLTAKSGSFGGSFVLGDGRKVTFSGALAPAPDATAEATDIGRGFFLVPPKTKGAESAAGEIRLIAPAAAL